MLVTSQTEQGQGLRRTLGRFGNHCSKLQEVEMRFYMAAGIRARIRAPETTQQTQDRFKLFSDWCVVQDAANDEIK